MVEAIDAGMRLTPPYGKSASRGQMHQRDAAMQAQRQMLRGICAIAAGPVSSQISPWQY